ncbi:XRE family transcriptional regulator [Aerococcus viridans]|uniref:XRE family transcriptional regulator n=1 Tax=Aerococcus viridans TaxID=1377 RepID=A0A2N6UFS7_9LACT|nr:helix-turn-helix transcriptional regulator [Aerococcus viridans]PMC80481.1 XRE family transcriptional regulator [Aerococcus viridans]
MLLKNKLRHIVNLKGINPYQLSKKMGVSPTQVHKILTGKSKDMKLSTAFKLADTLGVDINEFREEG